MTCSSDMKIVALLMFFLGVLVTFSLVRTFGDADASESEYYKFKDGIAYWNNKTYEVTKDCDFWAYGYSACQRVNIVILQNEKIITLLEEIKNATRG